MSVPISADQLIDVIYRDVFVAAVDDCESALRNPSGRNPGEAALDMKDWYSSLSESDRAHLRAALQKAADYAVFGMLCLLDNVRPVTDGFVQELRLSVEAGGDRFDLGTDEQLHDIFRAKVALEQA